METEHLNELFYTKKEPRKSFATFMRNQNKMYVNAFNMIDRKTAMMIRVNSTIISGIVVFFQHIEEIPYGKFIGISMVICSFISLMFALNASRPHIFLFLKNHKKNIENKYPKLEENIFTIGMFNKVTLENYEKAYDKLVNNQELQIGNQVRTMYLFEKQIKRAFKYIEMAYLSFMVGFIVLVSAFVISNLI